MKKCLKLISISGLLFLQIGCTHVYNPTIYQLSADRIATFKVNGTIIYKNGQPSSGKEILKLHGNTWEYDFKGVTDGFNNQLAHEVKARGNITNKKVSKLLISKVTKIKCEKPFGSYVRYCDISVVIVTGDGESVSIDAHQGTPIFSSMERSLDGTIATAVIDTLKHKKILAYLAR